MIETRFPGGFCRLRPQLPSAQTLPCRLTLLQESSAALIRDLSSIVLMWVVLHHPLPGSWIFTAPRAFTSGSSQPASEYKSPYRNLVFQSQTIAHIIPAPACSFLCTETPVLPLNSSLNSSYSAFSALSGLAWHQPLLCVYADSEAGLPGFESQVFHIQLGQLT